MRKIGKMGKKNIGGGLAIGGILIVLLIVGYMAFGQNINQPSNPNVITGCDSTTSPNITIKAYDKETGTALTEATNLYRVKGDKTWSTFTAGTGFAANAGDTLEIVMGIDTTDFTDNAYGQKKEVVVECKETPSVEFEMVNDEVETSLSATFLDAEESASAETYVAGQTQDITIKLQAGVKEYFGNPYIGGNSNVLVLNLNTSEWDAPTKVSVGGVELSKVATPQRHVAVASMIAYAYEMPVITDVATKIVVSMNADDTNAPATDMTAHMYAGNYYYNADNQAIESGVENEEGLAVGTDSSDTLVLDFTA